jgi:hypothetical protein
MAENGCRTLWIHPDAIVDSGHRKTGTVVITGSSRPIGRIDSRYPNDRRRGIRAQMQGRSFAWRG